MAYTLVSDYFNCTIQELKRNQSSFLLLKCMAFQLHHTGIKTCAEDTKRADFMRFQLHHTGIKTADAVHVRGAGALISIAPYRN